MTKKILIPVAHGSEDVEAVTMIDIVRRSGANVTVASIGDRNITCSNGTTLVADKKISDCVNETFDLIALPGGDKGAHNLRDCAELTAMLKAQDQEGRYVAAICASPAIVLEDHGIIRGRAATCYPTYSDMMSNKSRLNDRVVVDGNLITSRSPGTALEFALKLVECVVSPEKAAQISQGILAK